MSPDAPDDENPLTDRDVGTAIQKWWPSLASGIILAFPLGVTKGPVGALMGFVLGGLLGFAIPGLMMRGSERAVKGFLLPDDRGGVGVGYSHIETLEARGDIAGALAAWEEAIAASSDALAARLAAADLYARKGNNNVRAAELFRDAQSHSKATDEIKRYVTQRLIDLYLGPLNEEGRALVELRKIAEWWPDTRDGRGAAEAIAKIKAERRARAE